MMPNEWSSFEFIPKETEIDNDFDIENNSGGGIGNNSGEYQHFEAFFSTFSHHVDGLGLIERDTDAVYKFCINLTKKINELNQLLISDPNGFSADEVCSFVNEECVHYCANSYDFSNRL